METGFINCPVFSQSLIISKLIQGIFEKILFGKQHWKLVWILFLAYFFFFWTIFSWFWKLFPSQHEKNHLNADKLSIVGAYREWILTVLLLKSGIAKLKYEKNLCKLTQTTNIKIFSCDYLHNWISLTIYQNYYDAFHKPKFNFFKVHFFIVDCLLRYGF